MVASSSQPRMARKMGEEHESVGAWAGGPRPRSEARPAASCPHGASPCPSRNSFQALLRTWSFLRPGSLRVPCPSCPLCPPEDMTMRMSFHLTSRRCPQSPQRCLELGDTLLHRPRTGRLGSHANSTCSSAAMLRGS